MNRILLFLLILICTASCTKEKKVCWKCTFSQGVNGTTEPARQVCNDGTYPNGLKDEQGNDLSYHCEKE